MGPKPEATAVSDDSFEHRVRTLDDRWAIIEVAGEFKFLSPDGLADVYDEIHDELRGKGVTLIGFDISKCTTITSSTLAALILVVAQLADGDPFLLVIESGFIVRQIQSMNIADRVPIYPSVDAAIESLESGGT
jgi:hypothetical protein